MSKTIPLRKNETVRLELTVEELILQSKKILEIKEKAMVKDVHFGIIPGTRKPSLWKPGAEKLCQAFRLDPEFETTSFEDPNRTIKWEKWDYKNKKQIEGTTQGFMECNSTCTLIHIPTGDVWVRCVSGTCNNFESKYRSLNPYDLKNTLQKMAEKRSYVSAVLVGLAASDIFSHDFEGLDYLNDGNATAENDAPEGHSNTVGNDAGGDDAGGIRMATDKQVDYIKRLLNKKNIPENEFFEEWEGYFDSWDNIPFGTVNEILEWIRED